MPLMEKRVGMNWRLLSLLIDAVAVWIVIAGLQQLATHVVMRDTGPVSASSKQWVGEWFLLLVAPPLAGVMVTLCDVFFAATPGRALLRMRIASETGRRATRRQLLTRWAIKYAPLIFMSAWIAYFAVQVAVTGGRGMSRVMYAQRFILTANGAITLIVGVGGLWALKKPRRQAMHDRIARTAVFRARDITTSSFEPVMAVPVTTSADSDL
jgi:uncharacterized RDD family membrane protein YckC